MSGKEQRKTMGKIVTRAWADEKFKQRLLASPSETLKEEGVAVPPGVDVRVVENTDNVYYLVLPVKKMPGELSESDLRHVAGGGDCAPTVVMHGSCSSDGSSCSADCHESIDWGCIFSGEPK